MFIFYLVQSQTPRLDILAFTNLSIVIVFTIGFAILTIR